MRPRWLFVLTIIAMLASVATAQPPAQPPYVNAPYVQVVPMPPNQYGGADPYAMGVRPAGWMPNLGWGGFTMPSVNSVDNRLWFRAEYLYWWTNGMDLPPLITTSPAGTPQTDAAILGLPGTSVLFGNQEINGDGVSGVRLRGGFWLTRDGAFAIEAEYFRLGSQNDGYNSSGDIGGRPFFDILNGRETAQLFNFPGVANGTARVRSDTDFNSFLINGRAALLPTRSLACDSCGPTDRVDWIVGYRRMELRDRLQASESIESLVPAVPGTIALNDRFATKNEFNGLQLGIVYQANFQRAWLESMMRVAVGNNRQTVNINGTTDITELGVTDTFPGGLLAQRSNIGNYQRDEFTMVPEVGLTLGIRVTDRLHATVGYTVLYFPNVVRAGEQSDLDVNPNLIPEEVVPFAGALRPRFRYMQSDYWAHGLNLGAELRF